MSVAELAQLVQFPNGRDFVVPWPVVESDMGTRLPQDYKDIVEHFGPGEFSPFLVPLVPGIESPLLELRYNLRRFRESVGPLGSDSPISPFVPYPESGGLIPWAVSGTGQIYYWKTVQSGPDSWTVVVRESRGPRSYEFPGGVLDFMLNLFRGLLAIPFIPNLNEEQDEDDDDFEPEVLIFKPDSGSWANPGALEVISGPRGSR